MQLDSNLQTLHRFSTMFRSGLNLGQPRTFTFFLVKYFFVSPESYFLDYCLVEKVNFPPRFRPFPEMKVSLQDVNVLCTIHNPLDLGKPSKTDERETTPWLYVPTSMFHMRDGVSWVINIVDSAVTKVLFSVYLTRSFVSTSRSVFQKCGGMWQAKRCCFLRCGFLKIHPKRKSSGLQKGQGVCSGFPLQCSSIHCCNLGGAPCSSEIHSVTMALPLLDQWCNCMLQYTFCHNERTCDVCITLSTSMLPNNFLTMVSWEHLGLHTCILTSTRYLWTGEYGALFTGWN